MKSTCGSSTSSTLAVVLAGLAVAGLTARHFARTGWPIHHANPWLVALAALIVARRLRAQGLGLAAALPRERAPDDADARRRGRRRLGRAGSRCPAGSTRSIRVAVVRC